VTPKEKVLDATPNSILLLKEDNTTALIPANTYNTLKYLVKDIFSGIQGESHTKIYLGGDCVISPTTQEYVFCMEYNGDLVHTPPEKDREVGRAVLDAYVKKNFQPFIALFNELYQKQLRTEFLELMLCAFGDRIRAAAPSQRDSGYFIDNTFFVAQNGNAYKVAPGGDLRHLCIVPKNHTIKETHLTYRGRKIILGQQEQIFLSKIVMLLNKEKYIKDTVFWNQVRDN